MAKRPATPTPARRRAPAAKPAPKAPAKAPRKGADPHAKDPLWPMVDAALRERIAARPLDKKLAARALQIADELALEFPDATCALSHEGPLQLLVATILSAQCTDARVNMVTPALFQKYPTAADFAAAPEGELEKDIHSTGFFNNKAKAIRAACADIEARFGGQVPQAMEDLLTLRGVARKTANVVRCNCFGYPALTVDTHFQRIMGRLGLSKAEEPEKIEADVARLLPPSRWSHFCHAVILHGRATCTARKAKCDDCRLAALCPSAFKVK